MVSQAPYQTAVLRGAHPPRGLRREQIRRFLEFSFSRHPILTLSCSLAAAGAGMLLAVGSAVSAVIVPLSLLLGWF